MYKLVFFSPESGVDSKHHGFGFWINITNRLLRVDLGVYVILHNRLGFSMKTFKNHVFGIFVSSSKAK